MALTANANDFPEISGPLLKNMDGTELLEAIQQIDDADSYVALHECISTIPAKYGLTMINAWQGNLATWMPLDVPVDWELLCEEPVTMKNRKVHISLFLSKGLMDWKQDYLKNDYIKVDPVFWSTLFIDRPFFWDHRFRSEIVSNEQQQFMEVARDRGFHSGWVKPFHGRGMELGALAYFAAADRFDLEE
ncbi:MAG: autoinducer binding domain-containing protein, partial [Rhodospirillaceae bacterium]